MYPPSRKAKAGEGGAHESSAGGRGIQHLGLPGGHRGHHRFRLLLSVEDEKFPSVVPFFTEVIMNPLDWAAIVGLVLTCLIYRYSMRTLKAQLAREEAATNAKIATDLEEWRRKIQVREAALQPPSEN